MPKLTIIDGNSLLFRSYYATAYPGVEIMRASDGTPTNAIFAFSNMMNKIVSSLKEGEGILVAFDAGKHNFRHDSLETYKANRKPAPEDLVKQFPIARDFLSAFGLFQFEEVGFEGDDIAGTAARLAEQEGYEVRIFTSDRDFLQLVNDKISVHIIRKGLSDVIIMTPEKVKEDYGFEPIQIIDYKGLRGDTSDNLPGIPGIGEKTAVKLIQEYGSFDNIIANAPNIKGKVGTTILENQEIGKISRDLAIIKTDITLPFNIEDTIYKGYDFKQLNDFCQKYELKQFISKVNQKWKRKGQNYDDIEVEVISSFKDIKPSKEIGVALDYSDDNYTEAEILGIAISDEEKVYYETISDLEKDDTLKSILVDGSYHKYCYDFKAIKVALSHYNIPISGLKFDLLLASYLIDSNVKSSIVTVLSLFGIDYGNNEPDSMSLFTSENPKSTGKVAYFAKILYQKAYLELTKNRNESLYENLELPLADTLSKMEIEGFPVDKKMIEAYGKIFKDKANAHQDKVFELAGETFNLNSPQQLGDILYNKLGLKSDNKKSTDVDALERIINHHPIVKEVLMYRKYNKLVSTYTTALIKYIGEDNKIHAKFNQALTTTGRLSSSDPNLQNISVRDEEAKQIRKAFHYENYEYDILSLDYSQIELRILASLSNCAPLKEIFLAGEDIHAATAKKIFNLKGEPTDEQRRKAKTVNFGIVYGITDYGLSEQLGSSFYEAKEIINNFYKMFPEILTFFSEVVKSANKNGYVETLFGRRRYINLSSSADYQVRDSMRRAAMNAPIQGTAADLIKTAMIQVDKALSEGNYKTKMISQIHDELIFKVPHDEKETVYPLIKNIMENAIKLDVPLVVDGGFGKDWYEAK